MGPKAAIARLEAKSLGAGEFRHSDHVRMAWNYLQEYPLAAAIGRHRAAQGVRDPCGPSGEVS